MEFLHISRTKLLGEISALGKLLLVMPATNAVGERSFSASRRGKTYLNSTTGESRLNHLMMLHVHKDGTDAPTLVDVGNDFVGGERKPKAIAWQIFRERYAKQVLCFVKVNTNGKLETRTKGIIDKCSDLTFTKKYALNEEPKPGGGGKTWATCSPPPIHFMLDTGLKIGEFFYHVQSWKR